MNTPFLIIFGVQKKKMNYSYYFFKGLKISSIFFSRFVSSSLLVYVARIVVGIDEMVKTMDEIESPF